MQSSCTINTEGTFDNQLRMNYVLLRFAPFLLYVVVPCCPLLRAQRLSLPCPRRHWSQTLACTQGKPLEPPWHPCKSPGCSAFPSRSSRVGCRRSSSRRGRGCHHRARARRETRPGRGPGLRTAAKKEWETTASWSRLKKSVLMNQFHVLLKKMHLRGDPYSGLFQMDFTFLTTTTMQTSRPFLA